MYFGSFGRVYFSAFVHILSRVLQVKVVLVLLDDSKIRRRMSADINIPSDFFHSSPFVVKLFYPLDDEPVCEVEVYRLGPIDQNIFLFEQFEIIQLGAWTEYAEAFVQFIIRLKHNIIRIRWRQPLASRVSWPSWHDSNRGSRPLFLQPVYSGKSQTSIFVRARRQGVVYLHVRTRCGQNFSILMHPRFTYTYIQQSRHRNIDDV